MGGMPRWKRMSLRRATMAANVGAEALPARSGQPASQARMRDEAEEETRQGEKEDVGGGGGGFGGAEGQMTKNRNRLTSSRWRLQRRRGS